MGRELLVVHFGQAGVQMGSAIWELFCIEHRIAANGELIVTSDAEGISTWENLGSLFYEGQKTWTPRAVMVDLEPTVIDEVRCGAYRQLWKPNCLITGKEDAANNFGRGHCTVGKHKMEETLEAIRKMVEDSSNLAAFELIHSHSGGTGSGFTTLITDQLCDEYGKKFKFSTSIFPSAMYSQSTVDPYNAILHAHSTIDTLDCDILVDNQTLFDRCARNLGIIQPSFSEINRLLAQMLSSLFLSHRFIYHGSQHADTTELLTNLIPYPRIHFPSLFYAPLVPRTQLEHDALTVQELTRAVFGEEAQTIDYSCRRNAYISCAMLYRGVSSPKQVYDALQVVKSTRSVGATFVDWCPTGFKIGLNSYPPASFTNSPLAQSPRSVCMLAGNLGMREAWHRNNLKFDVLFSRRCFVHWFIGEGIEESEFIEARDDMAYLEQDYTELMSETGPTAEQDPHTEVNVNNPVIDGVVHDLDGVHTRTGTKKDLQDITASHIRQSNNANSVHTSDHYRGSHTKRHSVNSAVSTYHPRDVDSIDYYDSDGYRAGSNWSRGERRERNDAPARSIRAQAVNYTEQPHWYAHSHDSSRSENSYAKNNRSIYEKGSERIREPSGIPLMQTPPRGDDYVTTERSHIMTTGPMTSVSHFHTTEVSSMSGPRDLNMNYPKHSMASTGATFMPTDPIVRPHDQVCAAGESDGRIRPDAAQRHCNSKSSFRGSAVSDHSVRTSRSNHTHPERSFDYQTSSQSLCTQSSYSGSVIFGRSSRSVPRPIDRSQDTPDHAINLRDGEEVDGDITDCSVLIATRDPSEATIESPRIIPLMDAAAESCYPSGFGRMRNSSPKIRMRHHTPQHSSMSSSHAGSGDHKPEVNIESPEEEQGRRHRRHRYHHHHHHARHHRHHHLHTHHDPSGRRHHSQVINRSPQDQPHCLHPKHTIRGDYCSSPLPSASSRNGTLQRGIATQDGQALFNGQEHHRSSSMVVKLPVYEVSISSTPEHERTVVTPVLSAWSASDEASTRAPVANY